MAGDERAHLSYSAPEAETQQVSSGGATVVRERAKAEELWQPLLTAWFLEDLDDPDVALLKVTIEQAEYWDSSSTKMVQLARFVKAIATGREYEPGDGEELTLASV